MPEPLNIVWIVSDHHAYAHHRLLGGEPISRPAFDWIASKGVQFSRAYSVCPICTPARASMLTGCYPHRHDMTANAGRFNSREEFDPTQKLISHHLREAGYRCAYFGKWHCGEKRSARDYGFEGFSLPGYGYPYKSQAYANYLEDMGLNMPAVFLESFPKEFSRKQRVLVNSGNWFDSVAGSAIMEGPPETHEAFFISHLASEWIQNQATKAQPFFLRVDAWGPHPPYTVSEPFLDTVDVESIPEYPNFRSDLAHRPHHHSDYRNYWRKTLGFDWLKWRKELARCYEHVTLVDTALANVIQVLEQNDLLHNTAIIYTADHGDALGSNGGVANKGALMVEETTRIPLAMYHPDLRVSGIKNRQLVSNMDLVPTVLEFAGAGRVSPMDGHSLVPLLSPSENEKWHEALMLEHYGLDRPCFQRMLRWRNYKYVVQRDGFEEVYNLDADPYEIVNLALQPDGNPLISRFRRILRDKMTASEDNSMNAHDLLAAIDW